MTPTDPIAAAFASVLGRFESDATIRAYEGDWKRYCAWLERQGVPVLEVKPSHVEAHIAALRIDGMKKSTTGRALSVIREVYGAFVRNELIGVNPAREVKNIKQKGEKKTPYLREIDLAKVLQFSGPKWVDRRDRLCVQMLAGTGRRRAEVARMQVEHFEDGCVTGEVKGGKTVRATVSPWLLTEVRLWCAYAGIEKGPLFPRAQDDSHEISGDIVYSIVKRVAESVRVSKLADATPHALRRTLATLSKKKGVPLGDIQQTLAHASITTTEGYLKGSEVLAHSPSEWMGDLVKPKGDESD